MHAAKGILTSRGGMTSHAAVVARGMGKACVCGAGELQIDYAEKARFTARATVKEGDVITIDGATGEVMLGKVPTVEPELSGDFATLMDWADANPPAQGPHQRRDAARRPHGPSSSAPRASACAAPSTCSSSPTASSPCAR